MIGKSEGKPSLLFLTQRLPYPPTKGEKIRQYQILRRLADFFTIYLGCLIDDPADCQYIDVVKAFCREIHAPLIARNTARIRCLVGLLTGEPLSVSFFRNYSLRQWVDETISRVKPDVVFVISSNMAPYVLPIPHAPVRVVDLVDVDSEKWRAYSNNAGWLMRAVYRREWKRVAALEDQIVRQCDHSLFVSDAEAALMRRRTPGYDTKISGLSNGVDHAYFNPNRFYRNPFKGDAPTFVFTGTMDYPPNVDAVCWFARDILPLIRKQDPSVRFCIVGNHPVSAVRQLEYLDGVTVTGWVSDVRPYLAHATVAVAPMRIARGVQNKVLEAMAMGRPVVVTDGALEGIDAEHGLHLLLANDPDAFAAACLRVAGPDGVPLGRAARQQAIARYDWSIQLDSLIELLNRSCKSSFELSSAGSLMIPDRPDSVREGPEHLEGGSERVFSGH